MYYPWLRTGDWVKSTKCKKYPCISALFWTCCLEPWHDISRFLSFPGVFVPEYQSLKGLIFISTVLRSHNGNFYFFFSKRIYCKLPKNKPGKTQRRKQHQLLAALLQHSLYCVASIVPSWVTGGWGKPTLQANRPPVVIEQLRDIQL